MNMYGLRHSRVRKLVKEGEAKKRGEKKRSSVCGITSRLVLGSA